MPEHDVRDPPPRKPGPAKTRDVYVTFQIRFGLALLAVALVLLVAALVGRSDATAVRAAANLVVILTVLGVAALVHAARVAWRGRRR